MTPPAGGLRPTQAIPATAAPEKKAQPKTVAVGDHSVKSKTKTIAPKLGPWEWIPDVKLRMNWGANGDREGHLFNDDFGQIGDFRNQGAAISLLTNANTDAVRVNLGGTVRWDYQKGRHIAYGSEYHHWLLGPSVEVDFRPAWAEALGADFSPLAYVGANFGIGYGWGEGTHNDGLNHRHGGLAMALSLYLNILNFSIGKAQINLDFDYTNTWIGGPRAKQNWPVSHGFGFAISVRPSVKKMIQIKEVDVPVCAEDRDRVPDLAAEVAQLQADQEVFQAKVDGLRYYLENLPKDPFNESNVKQALRMGYVAEALQQKWGGKNITTENLGKIQLAVKAASAAKPGEQMATLQKVTGLKPEEIKNIWAGAEAQVAQAKGFWSLPPDINLDEKALAEVRESKGKGDTQCDQVEKLRGLLEEWRFKLGRRTAALEQQYRRALHLAGLVLGEEVTKQIGTVFNATFLRVDTPNFITGRPRGKHMKAIQAAAEGRSIPGTVDEFLKISRTRGSKRVFILAREEAEKLKNLADWMNGKAQLKGEERHRQFLKDRGLDSKVVQDKQKDIEKAYQKWIKSLRIMVVGHTDSRGSDRYNQGLSDRRAEYIRHTLVFFGVAPDRVKSFGAGEKYPIVPERKQRGKGRTAARLKNRRVEFIPVTGDPYSTGLDRSKLPGEHHDSSKTDPKKAKKAVPAAAKRPATKPVPPPTDIKK